MEIHCPHQMGGDRLSDVAKISNVRTQNVNELFMNTVTAQSTDYFYEFGCTRYYI